MLVVRGIGRRLVKLRLAACALAAVVVVRLAITFRKTRRIESHIATARLRAPAPHHPLLHDLREVSWSVAAAARLVPKATCLTQALAGDWLLALRGRTGEINLSLPRGVTDGFRPHAWLLCDGQIVLGGTASDYRAHSMFSAVQR